MEKDKLLIEIDKASAYIENVINSENKSDLRELTFDLNRVRLRVINGSLRNNPLRGFPRKYAEMYNDYLHPITNVLSNIEKYVDLYLTR